MNYIQNGLGLTTRANPFAVLGLQAGVDKATFAQEAMIKHYRMVVRYLHEKGPEQVGLTVDLRVPKLAHFNMAKDKLLGLDMNKDEFDRLR